MIENSILGLLVIFTLYYVYFIVRVRIGLRSLRFASSASHLPRVSVVLAARNEEKTIEQCLQALLHQTYPTTKYEIIVVDDGSTDKTASLVRSFSESSSRIRLVSLPIEAQRKTSRKPLAIAKGIAQTTGEIILTTDADCIAPNRWIEIMVNHFEEKVVFVAGPVAEQSATSFFSRLEQLEFLGLITTAAGLIGSGRPIICNGANLAYRKKSFNDVCGFDGNTSSNDDESLMNRIVQRKIGEVVFAPEADAVVVTNSKNTMLSFLRQRARWANKRGHYEDKSILITLAALYFFFLSLVIAAALIPYEPRIVPPLILAFSAKVLVDYFTVRYGAQLFHQHIPLVHFLIAEILHVPYIVIAAAIGQIASLQWKGRSLRQ